MEPTKNWAYVDFYYADLHLPAISGIYAVFAARCGRDICIYVGQSKNSNKPKLQTVNGSVQLSLFEGFDMLNEPSVRMVNTGPGLPIAIP